MADQDQAEDQDQAPDQDGESVGGEIHSSTEHGTAASHPERLLQSLLVAPTTASDFNTLSLDLVPVACLSLHDLLFEFDSSFPLPTVALMLKELPGLREAHKNARGQRPPASIFGHADPVGTDAYNKQLSGRRARAIYGLLTNDVVVWDKLYNEEWHSKTVLQTMREATGKPAGESRSALMKAYMTQLFPAKLDKSDFLGKGVDPKGKADFQGCSEFNPLIILSQDENANLPAAKRNAENQPNRRVVIFLFRPGLILQPKLWPCPAAEDPSTQACKQRFFGPPNTGELRRQAAATRREFARSGDTFACRFYDRVARLSPCENPGPILGRVRPFIFFEEPVLSDAPVEAGDPPPAALADAPAKEAPPAPPVAPTVTSGGVVVVKKKHTNPARVPVVLKTDKAFTGKGEFTATPADTILFFPNKKGGAAIKFDGKQNVFLGPALTKSVTLFAEAAKVSGSFNDVTITLKLSGGLKTIANNPKQAKMTAIDVSLQICKPRTAPGADPPALSEAEKIDPGRAIHVQNSASKHLRAMVIVGPVKPAGFKGKLQLTTDNTGKGSVVLFLNEKQTAGELPSNAMDIPVAGKKVFVEGIGVSGKVKDTKVKLGIPGAESDADHVILTVIEAKLDICKSREKAGKEPEPLSDADKINVGRAVAFKDAIPRHRAMMIIRQVKPADFTGKLVLARRDGNVDSFEAETGGAALPASVEFNHDAKFPVAGIKRFVQGARVSAGLADTGFKLGVKDVEDECDSVSVTVFQVEKVEVKLKGTPCKRDGSRANTMAAKVFTKDSKTFDATAITIVRECGDLEMEATVKPAGITLAWDRERASDDTGLKGLPTHADNGGNKKRKVTADATGSFHVFAFVDTNGNGKRNGDEDGITVNVNMVEIEVLPGVPNNKILSAATYSNTVGSLNVSSGPGLAAGVGTQAAWGDAGFANHAIAMKVTVKLTGGGAHQRRGTDKVILGYIQDTPNDTFRGTYADGRTEREVIFTLPVPGRVVLPPPPPPPAPPPAPVALVVTPLSPVRDHAGILNFNGINTFINSSSDNNPPDRKDLAAGGQSRVVRFVDSPAAGCDLVHPVTGSALASISGANFFIVFLVAFSTDLDENFTVVATANWSTTYGTFTPGVGWTPAGAAVTKSGNAMTVNKPLVKGESTNLERCPPAYTDNFAMDAR